MENSGDQFDAIVVGAGVMGSSTAYQLAKRGLKVILLEQFDLLHHRGSSHGESRTLRATYTEAYYAAMVMDSLRLWEEAEAEIGYKVYFKTQHFDMGPSDDKSLQSIIANCHLNSVPHQVLDSHQMSDKLSGRIQVPENWVCVVSEIGGVIKPTKAVSMFQTLAIRNGAVIRDNMEVREMERDDVRGGVWVSTASGERFWGRKCVVTAGAWMKKLVKRVSGMEIPIQPLEICVMYWRIRDGHEAEFAITAGGGTGSHGGFPTFASYGEPFIYGTPSLEFPGLIKIPVPGGQGCDPERRKWAAPDPNALASVKEWIRVTFGDRVDASGPVMVQSCLYSMSPDEDFVIDFLGGGLGKEVVVAGGFSGHGFKMAPVVGRILADLVVNGEARGVDLRHFELARFEGNPKGNVKDFEDQVKFSRSYEDEGTISAASPN
ncbi:Sarcosine oxidase [Actinidia chinensis var. chinensis]|uniref:Sarcosine oxidase n=1 Tax=Actinidia chinensis var. chinensis TaxID=1590841 RepID=A0A2R6Q2E5_ACTCC|nr:Sarcosine oxidase [Actinidia chinensis var. chinensis]